MTAPRVTVLMPIFNAGRYLELAVQSILAQTFTDFEFLIIDDGSTDDSLEKLANFQDSRIRLVSNDKNLGLVYSLNRGIELSRGEYIARMDADDISLPERLATQISYLETNRNITAVFAFVELIDINNKSIGTWLDDQYANDTDVIRRTLPTTNCLAHPTALIKSSVLKSFKYRACQKNSEDWDLWLRLSSRGLYFGKICKTLLKYRVHQESVTIKSNKNGIALKIMKVQFRFLFFEMVSFRLNTFNLKVLVRLLKNVDSYYAGERFFKLLKYHYTPLTRYIDKLRVNHIRHKLNWNPEDTISGKRNILFIIPHMVMGGADQVNLNILSGIDRKLFSIHIFTTNKIEHSWRDKFHPYSDTVFDITQLTDNSNYVYATLHFIELFKIDILFISNSSWGYTFLPKIRHLYPRLKIIDLMHGQGGILEHGGMPEFSKKYDWCIDKRLVINDYLKNYLIENLRVDPCKITTIYNGVDTNYFDPSATPSDYYRQKFQLKASDRIIAYIGRLNYEKHPEHIISIAKILCQTRGDLRFFIAGNGTQYDKIQESILDKNLSKFVFLLGEIDDVRLLLKDSDILYLCSEMEGLPIVILEAMAMGVPIISSDVGGIFELVENDANGCLISYDGYFVQNSIEKIEEFLSMDLQKFSARNRAKIIDSFSLENMKAGYNNIFITS